MVASEWDFQLYIHVLIYRQEQENQTKSNSNVIVYFLRRGSTRSIFQPPSPSPLGPIKKSNARPKINVKDCAILRLRRLPEIKKFNHLELMDSNHGWSKHRANKEEAELTSKGDAPLCPAYAIHCREQGSTHDQKKAPPSRYSSGRQ